MIVVCTALMLTGCTGLTHGSYIEQVDQSQTLKRRPGNLDNGNNKMTTVFLVRHAEPDYTKEWDPRNPRDPCRSDPYLSDVGKAHAEQLIQVSEKANVEAIYSAECNRTWESALL